MNTHETVRDFAPSRQTHSLSLSRRCKIPRPLFTSCLIASTIVPSFKTAPPRQLISRAVSPHHPPQARAWMSRIKSITPHTTTHHTPHHLDEPDKKPNLGFDDRAASSIPRSCSKPWRWLATHDHLLIVAYYHIRIQHVPRNQENIHFLF